MSFLELATLMASAATVFGLIVGVFSVWNGRTTRREIGAFITQEGQATRDLIAEESRATRDLIAEESRATRDLIAREEQATRQLMDRHQQATQQILSSLTQILDRIDERVR